MTAANLAVIFGPNLLQKERGSERELSPRALGIEDSTAVISVTLLLIQNHKHLFMVRERDDLLFVPQIICGHILHIDHHGS